MPFSIDQQTLLRHAIVVLAVAAVTLAAQILQRKDGVPFHSVRRLRANLVYRVVGPIALVVSAFILLLVASGRGKGLLAGAILGAAFGLGGLWLIYYCSVRRIAWSGTSIGLWTPLRKWRVLDFVDIVRLDYSRLRQELLIVGSTVVIGCADSFDGFEQLIHDLRRARPDLFGDDDGEAEPEAAEDAAYAPAFTPAAATGSV